MSVFDFNDIQTQIIHYIYEKCFYARIWCNKDRYRKIQEEWKEKQLCFSAMMLSFNK